MQSERSTISATFPYSSSFELASEQNSWNISYRFVTSCQFFPFVSQNKIEWSKSRKCFGDAGHRSPYLSHAKRALYHLSYIPVPFRLRASFWTKSMIYQLSICNELPILSYYQPEQNRIVEASKMFWRCGASIPYLSHAKRALYHLSYIPVPFKLRASFWTKFMKYQLSICNELPIPSHYQQTPYRIVEASKCFGDARHRSTHPSDAKRALYQLSYIPVLFKLRGSLWTKFMIDQLSICNQLSILSFCQPEQNRIVEASKMYWDAGQRSLYLTC